MIDSSEKCNGWLNLELKSPYVIERCTTVKQNITFLSHTPGIDIKILTVHRMFDT